MLVYRLSQSQFANDLSGEGARIYGGRWNRKGQAVLYTSEHRSLAILEMLAHQSENLWSHKFVIASIEIPDSEVQEVSFNQLSPDWSSPTNYSETQELGGAWLLKSSLVLKVPSALVHQEYHYILNPKSSLYKKVKLVNIESFTFDRRLK